MRSLVKLRKHPDIPDRQKAHFNGQVWKRLNSSRVKDDIAEKCLQEIWCRYDTGGHSHGRSLRSGVLEKVQLCLECGEREKAKIGLSILLAMYYDATYINVSHWFDHSLEALWESPLDDRICLYTAALIIGVKDIPYMEDWPYQKIKEFITSP